ncbi:MAG: putative transcriptional regulator, partial [Candidatus Saccharibacteria bacterium]|nr:putative transcriptional regulator [Candidatus Saccharibacteria bacterium]
MKLSFDYTLFGLEPRDLAVYEAMLTNPEASSIRTIAAQVNMNRGTTFEVIKKLVRIGAVASYYKNSRKYYRAAPPDSLKKYAEMRQQAISDEVHKVEHYVGQLEMLQPQERSQQFGKYYEGEDEIAALLQDVLITVAVTPDKSYRVISSAEVSNHLYGKFRNFTRQRIKLGLFVRVIGVGGEGKRADLSERKVLTSEQAPPSYIIVYGDKV